MLYILKLTIHDKSLIIVHISVNREGPITLLNSWVKKTGKPSKYSMNNNYSRHLPPKLFERVYHSYGFWETFPTLGCHIVERTSPNNLHLESQTLNILWFLPLLHNG